MCDELREKEQRVAASICTVLIVIILVLISYCFVTEAKASETKWKSKYITVTATAYCLCKKCTGKDIHDGKTATGTDARSPGIAVDPQVIVKGSRIDCSEYKRQPTWCEADDVGGGIKGNHIDLRMNSHQEAKIFGVQKVNIRVWSLR